MGLQMKYFVLKPSGSSAYSEASKIAILAYAEAIREENEELSKDLITWINSLKGSGS